MGKNASKKVINATKSDLYVSQRVRENLEFKTV